MAKHTHPFQFLFLVLAGPPSFAISLETHRSIKRTLLSLLPAQLLTCILLLGGLPPPTQGSHVYSEVHEDFLPSLLL